MGEKLGWGHLGSPLEFMSRRLCWNLVASLGIPISCLWSTRHYPGKEEEQVTTQKVTQHNCSHSGLSTTHFIILILILNEGWHCSKNKTILLNPVAARGGHIFKFQFKFRTFHYNFKWFLVKFLGRFPLVFDLLAVQRLISISGKDRHLGRKKKFFAVLSFILCRSVVADINS